MDRTHTNTANEYTDKSKYKLRNKDDGFILCWHLGVLYIFCHNYVPIHIVGVSELHIFQNKQKINNLFNNSCE